MVLAAGGDPRDREVGVMVAGCPGKVELKERQGLEQVSCRGARSHEREDNWAKPGRETVKCMLGALWLLVWRLELLGGEVEGKKETEHWGPPGEGFGHIWAFLQKEEEGNGKKRHSQEHPSWAGLCVSSWRHQGACDQRKYKPFCSVVITSPHSTPHPFFPVLRPCVVDRMQRWVQSRKLEGLTGLMWQGKNIANLQDRKIQKGKGLRRNREMRFHHSWVLHEHLEWRKIVEATTMEPRHSKRVPLKGFLCVANGIFPSTLSARLRHDKNCFSVILVIKLVFHLIFLLDETGLKARHKPFPQEAHSQVRGADGHIWWQLRVTTWWAFSRGMCRWPIIVERRVRGGRFRLEKVARWKEVTWHWVARNSKWQGRKARKFAAFYEDG